MCRREACRSQAFLRAVLSTLSSPKRKLSQWMWMRTRPRFWASHQLQRLHPLLLRVKTYDTHGQPMHLRTRLSTHLVIHYTRAPGLRQGPTGRRRKGHSIDCGAGGAYEKDTQVSRGVEEVQDHGRHWQERYKYKTGRATHLLSSTTFEMTQRHTNTVAWLEEIQLPGRLAHTTSGQQRGRGTEERLAQPFEKGSEVQVQWRTVMLIRGPCASLLRRAVLPT
jgi:hypothetical protein